MNTTEETLAAVGKQVFEAMAFTFEMPGQEAPAGGEAMLRATVAFNGPVHGALVVNLPQAMLPALVANMLGEDEGAELSEQQQYDGLGELANVICGNIVQALAGPQAVFALDSPWIESTPAPAGPPGSGATVTTARLSLESGWVELVLCVEDGPVADATASAGVPAASAR
jgi:CheY-specific phosphatase CheX